MDPGKDENIRLAKSANSALLAVTLLQARDVLGCDQFEPRFLNNAHARSSLRLAPGCHCLGVL